MSEWRQLQLGDVIRLKRGYDLPKKARSPGSVPIVSSSGVTDTHGEARVPGPGVITGRYGTIGEVYYITEDFWPLNTALYVEDFKGNDPRFISYFLKGIDFHTYSDKAAVPGVNRNHLHSASILFPESLREQQGIAGILASLDDKIELNRRMSETLDEIASTVFQDWFIRPTPNSIPGFEQPSKRLRDVLTLTYGKGLRKKDRIPGSAPVYGSGGVFDFHNEALIAGPAVIVGRKGTVGSLYWEDRPSYPGDTVFYVESEFPLTYCYYLLGTLGLNDMNTDAAVPGLNRENAYRLEVPSPPRELITQFDTVVGPMRERIRVANAESATLSELRDTLLPKLISGELRVPQAEELVGEVV